VPTASRAGRKEDALSCTWLTGHDDQRGQRACPPQPGAGVEDQPQGQLVESGPVVISPGRFTAWRLIVYPHGYTSLRI
jgi:hypothetical protein